MQRERVLYRQLSGLNPFNRRDDFSGPALRHESLNSLFQVALYLPSSGDASLPELDDQRGHQLGMLHSPPSPFTLIYLLVSGGRIPVVQLS